MGGRDKKTRDTSYCWSPHGRTPVVTPPPPSSPRYHHHFNQTPEHQIYPFSLWMQKKSHKLDQNIQTGYGLEFLYFPTVNVHSEPGIPLLSLMGGYGRALGSVPPEHGLHLLSDLASNVGRTTTQPFDDDEYGRHVESDEKRKPSDEALDLSREKFAGRDGASSPKEGAVPSGEESSHAPASPLRASVPMIPLKHYFFEKALADPSLKATMQSVRHMSRAPQKPNDAIKIPNVQNAVDIHSKEDGLINDQNGLSKDHQCPECGKCYSTSSNLARHRQIHRSVTDQKAKKCPHCDKVYVSMPALSMHIRTHKQNCKCHICGKCFSRPWLLQGHIRTHTGEKPFSCQQCGKAFADKSNLRAHVQTHSTVKPYSCPKCLKAFALKSYLYKHTESSCNRIR